MAPKDKDSPDLLIQVNKDKLKPWHVAVIVIVGMLLYFLTDFLKSTLESRLNDNQNVLVIVIVIGLTGLFAIVYFSINIISKKK